MTTEELADKVRDIIIEYGSEIGGLTLNLHDVEPSLMAGRPTSLYNPGYAAYLTAEVVIEPYSEAVDGDPGHGTRTVMLFSHSFDTNRPNR